MQWCLVSFAKCCWSSIRHCAKSDSFFPFFSWKRNRFTTVVYLDLKYFNFFPENIMSCTRHNISCARLDISCAGDTCNKSCARDIMSCARHILSCARHNSPLQKKSRVLNTTVIYWFSMKSIFSKKKCKLLIDNSADIYILIMYLKQIKYFLESVIIAIKIESIS